MNELLMSYLTLLLHSFWPNAEGVREAMRISYAKHLRLGKAGRIPTGGMTPHEAALYGALASRYRALGQVWCEGDLLVDLAPFLRMDANDGVEAVAEYAALKECPKEARVSWLKKEINQTIRKLAGTDRIEMEREALLFVPLLGLTDKQIEWWNLLGEQEIFLIMERHHRSQAPTESNDDPLKNEIADSVLRKAGYRPDILRETEYQPDDDEAESRAKALRQLFADHARLRARINAIPDEVKSAVLESENARELAALAKEVEQVLRNANYPDDLARCFQVLRQNGLSLKLAATCYDDPRGMFERWQYSTDSGERNATNVTLRFWHDTRDLDWQATLSNGDEIKAQASGQTLEQLETRLTLWAREHR